MFRFTPIITQSNRISLRALSTITNTTAPPPSLSLPSPPTPTVPRQRPIDNDTITFVDDLVAEGFQRDHAEALLQSMGDLLDSALHAATRDVVLRTEQDKVTYMYKVDFAQLKSELQMLSQNDMALLRGETERLKDEIEKTKQKVRDDINRVQAGFRLDLNLEKGRIRDEASGLQLKIRDTDAKMDTEFGNIRVGMDGIKYDTIRTIVGTLSTMGLLILGYMRFLKG